MNKYILITFFCFINICKGQDTTLVDVSTIRTPLKISNKSQVILNIKVNDFFIINSETLSRYSELINLYEQKDKLRQSNINDLNIYYEKLIDEYKNITNNIQNTITTTDGKILILQGNLSSIQTQIDRANGNIEFAKQHIDDSLKNIDDARSKIKSSIDDLNKNRKKFRFWIPVSSGIFGLVCGLLISK